jgi:lipopolysaccharide biosynthesis glycosyltransferase
MDCDMLVQCDIMEVFRLADARFALQVVQHDYVPKGKTKMLGATQFQYERKNWSSVMLFNNAQWTDYTPRVVSEEQGLSQHKFSHLADWQIGELPVEYNWLVGEYPENRDAKILHYTLGGPWWPEYRHCESAELWMAEYEHMQGSMHGTDLRPPGGPKP